MITKSHPPTLVPYDAAKNYLVHLHAGKTLTNCPELNFAGHEVGSVASVEVPGDTIVYENSSKRKFNYCRHTKDVLTHVSYCATSYRVYCTHSAITYGPAYHYKAGCWHTPSRPSEPTVPEVTAQMRREAWQELLPKLEDGFSLSNFIWELGEIPALLMILPKTLNFLEKSGARAILSKVGTKTASEIVLIGAFALLPLKGDLEFIASTLPSMVKKINKFIADGKKAQSFHHRKELGESISWSTAGNAYDRRVKTTTKSTYYATLRCKYEYTPPSGMYALRRLWGLQVNPEVIWNAIPFSFVVDWLVRVGDFLAQFSRDPYLTVEILDYCDTVKAEIIKEEVVGEGSTCSSWQTSPWNVHSNPGVTTWRWTRSVYVRTPAIPDPGVYFPVLDELSKRELVLSAALMRVQT